MPVGLRWGTVGAIGERHDGIVRLEVDGQPCVAFPRLTGEVEVGDVVLVNEQARQLELGSGGFDVLYANLTRGLRLPVAEREVIVARVEMGCDYAAIADMFSKPSADAARMAVSRALVHLAEEMHRGR